MPRRPPAGKIALAAGAVALLALPAPFAVAAARHHDRPPVRQNALRFPGFRAGIPRLSALPCGVPRPRDLLPRGPGALLPPGLRPRDFLPGLNQRDDIRSDDDQGNDNAQQPNDPNTPTDSAVDPTRADQNSVDPNSVQNSADQNPADQVRADRNSDDPTIGRRGRFPRIPQLFPGGRCDRDDQGTASP